MSLNRTHHATVIVVGPIRFSNRSNNCRVCKINERRSCLVRTHHAIFVFSSSLVCAGNQKFSDVFQTQIGGKFAALNLIDREIDTIANDIKVGLRTAVEEVVEGNGENPDLNYERNFGRM